MSETNYRLDDRYTEGVWYDQMNGDFCEIQRGCGPDDERIVQLVNPENGDIYWNIPAVEWVESERVDFGPVPTAAVENPAEYLSEILDAVQRNTTLTMEDRRGLSYVRSHHTIEVSE